MCPNISANTIKVTRLSCKPTFYSALFFLISLEKTVSQSKSFRVLDSRLISWIFSAYYMSAPHFPPCQISVTATLKKFSVRRRCESVLFLIFSRTYIYSHRRPRMPRSIHIFFFVSSAIFSSAPTRYSGKLVICRAGLASLWESGFFILARSHTFAPSLSCDARQERRKVLIVLRQEFCH